MLFLLRQHRSPLAGVPSPNSDVADAVTADPLNVPALLDAVFRPRPERDDRNNELLLWLLRARSFSTGSAFDVRIVSKMAVHLVYAAR